ncbi:MAG: hypothetical protein K2J30_01210, partial [Clostridia bacterium]|nr:hypothetical protein [Clostridia bacterium]
MEQKENTAKKHFLKNKGQRVMLIGIAVSVLICAVLFSILGVYMRKNSGAAVDYIGEETMRDASYQLTQRYEAVIEQRLYMVKALADEYGATDSEEELKRLKNSAEIRGFKYLGFMVVNEGHITEAEGGRTMDFILGDFIVNDLVPFRQSILDGEEKVAVGKQIVERRADNTVVYGEEIVMCSVPATEHTMPNGGKSMSLVAGISNKDFIEMLNIKSEGADTAAYIICE